MSWQGELGDIHRPDTRPAKINPRVEDLPRSRGSLARGEGLLADLRTQARACRGNEAVLAVRVKAWGADFV